MKQLQRNGLYNRVVDPMEITLAVLAGGASTRMGTPKAGLDIRGEPILNYLTKNLDWPGPTMLVTAPGREHPAGASEFDREVSDAIGGQGPLQGVLAGLQAMKTGSAVFMAVDMPAVQRGDLEWFARELDNRPESLGVVSMRDGTIEPLPCALRPGAIEIVERHLAQGRRSLRGLADDPRIVAVDAPLPPRVWLNVNTPAEWDQFLATLPD